MELRELGEKSRMGVRGGDFILKIRTSTGSGRARVKVARRAHAGLGFGGRCPMRTGRHTAVSLDQLLSFHSTVIAFLDVPGEALRTIARIPCCTLPSQSCP